MKTHLKALGNFPRHGHTWTPDKTLCGLKAVELEPCDNVRDGACLKCMDVWYEAHIRFGIGAQTYCKGVKQ